MFTFFGNYIPYSSRSSSISIRVKYTLENSIIWSRVHRFCGFLWYSGSIVFFPMLLFSSQYYLLFLSIIMINIFLLCPFIYAYYLHKKFLKGELDKKTQQKNMQHSH